MSPGCLCSGCRQVSLGQVAPSAAAHGSSPRAELRFHRTLRSVPSFSLRRPGGAPSPPSPQRLPPCVTRGRGRRGEQCGSCVHDAVSNSGLRWGGIEFVAWRATLGRQPHAPPHLLSPELRRAGTDRGLGWADRVWDGVVPRVLAHVPSLRAWDSGTGREQGGIQRTCHSPEGGPDPAEAPVTCVFLCSVGTWPARGCAPWWSRRGRSPRSSTRTSR